MAPLLKSFYILLGGAVPSVVLWSMSQFRLDYSSQTSIITTIFAFQSKGIRRLCIVLIIA